MFATRGYEVVRKLNGGRISLAPTTEEVKGSARNREITVGMFVVRASDGSVDGCRGANDTTNGGSGARDIVGLVKRILDEKGNATDKKSLGTTEAGRVQLYDDTENLEFRGVEDGAGGVLSYPTNRSVPQADGAILYTTSETPYPQPVANDKFDSSAAHATIGQHAFTLRGLDGDIRNVDNTNKVYLFQVAPGYLE